MALVPLTKSKNEALNLENTKKKGVLVNILFK